MQRGTRGVNTFAGSGGGRRNPIGGPIQGGDGGGGGGVLSRGTLPPGLITDDALNGAQLSTKHIRFHRQNFAYDETAYGSLGAHDNSGWSRVGGSEANQLQLQLGSSDAPFLAWVWGYFGWVNSTGTDHGAEAVLTLYQGTDSDADGVVDTFTTYERSSNLYRTTLLSNGLTHAFTPFSLLVVPQIDGVDWYVGMSCRYTSATGASNNNTHRLQTLMAWSTALDPELDSNLVGDTFDS